MCSTLRLPSGQSSSLSSAIRELVDIVRDCGGWRQWHTLVTREYGYVMALAREAAEKAKEKRDGAED